MSLGTLLGGYLVHDGSCDSTQEAQLETAAWDASTLANYAADWPRNARGIAAGNFYIGPDFATQQQRIQGERIPLPVEHCKLREVLA